MIQFSTTVSTAVLYQLELAHAAVLHVLLHSGLAVAGQRVLVINVVCCIS